MTCIAGLRGGIGGAARDDDGAVARCRENPARADELSEPADQADGRGGAERGQVVLVDLVAQPGVANLIQARELVQA